MTPTTRLEVVLQIVLLETNHDHLDVIVHSQTTLSNRTVVTNLGNPERDLDIVRGSREVQDRGVVVRQTAAIAVSTLQGRGINIQTKMLTHNQKKSQMVSTHFTILIRFDKRKNKCEIATFIDALLYMVSV